MSRLLLLEELHLALLAPEGLAEGEYEALCRVLASPDFRSALRAAVLQVVAERPELSLLRVYLTR